MEREKKREREREKREGGYVPTVLCLKRNETKRNEMNKRTDGQFRHLCVHACVRACWLNE